jgi:twitching motility protein PilT
MNTISGAGDKLTAFLKRMVDSGSSDLHITAASAPRLRVKGRLDPLDYPPLTAEETQDMLCAFLPDAKMERLEKERKLRFAFDIEGLARFKVAFFISARPWQGSSGSSPTGWEALTTCPSRPSSRTCASPGAA